MPHCRGVFRALVGIVATAVPLLLAAADTAPADYSAADKIFEEYLLDDHAPGVIYGVVADGHLVHVAAFGVQDLESKRPVTADTLFRIASMTKAFTALTILKLRDDGRLSLDVPASEYVPEMRRWTYPTQDSPEIRVRDLLNHASGFVTDDPWGDRQTPLPEEDFSRLLREGVPFTSAPATRFEYSNLGFAILGRIVTNVSGQPFEATIAHSLLQPLGMTASGFDAEKAPASQRALGYRWEDGAWRLEPTLGPGAFGAMGGLQTSANDYAKWIAFLLSAWPPRDGEEVGPVRRATVRELAQGSNNPSTWDRPAHTRVAASRQAVNYGMGMFVATDDSLGTNISHGGGYPGFGSALLILPERGVGLFAFANRTYAHAFRPLWSAALSLDRDGLLGSEREPAVIAALETAYRAAGAMYESGSIQPGRELLAMNFLLDRDADAWSRALAKLKAESGTCDTTAQLEATGMLSGEFTWQCAHGRISGSLLLAPTQPPLIQAWELSRITP